MASRRLLCRRYDNSDCRLLLLIVVGAVEDEVVVANVSLAHVLHQSTLALSCLMSDTATSSGSGGAQQFTVYHKRHIHPQREDLSSSRSKWTTYSTSKAELPHTGQRHLVILVVVVGGAEKGLHHLELAGDEHQVILHLLPQLLLLFHRRLDQAQRPLHRRLGQTKSERRHGCVALSIGSTLRPAQLCFVVMANNALQDCNGLCTWLDMGLYVQ